MYRWEQPIVSQKLEIKAGISSREELLDKGKTRAGRAWIAERTGASEGQILEIVNHVDLMRVPMIGESYVNLLEEAGVDTVSELASRNADRLYSKLVEINIARGLVKRLPARKQVEGWIEKAKQLPRLISF